MTWQLYETKQTIFKPDTRPYAHDDIVLCGWGPTPGTVQYAFSGPGGVVMGGIYSVNERPEDAAELLRLVGPQSIPIAK